MTDDIVDKIRKVAPTELDKFAADQDRRASLDDIKVTEILTNIFKNIAYENLPPEQQYRYHIIRGRLS